MIHGTSEVVRAMCASPMDGVTGSRAAEKVLALCDQYDRMHRLLDHWYNRASRTPDLAVRLSAEEIHRERDLCS